MRGRVMALYGMMFRGGPALQRADPGLAVVASSGCACRSPPARCICIAYWAWARSRQDEMERALEVEARGAAE